MKKIIYLTTFIFTLLMVGALASCDTAPEETAAPEPVLENFTPIVSATGEVVPIQNVVLSLKTGGIVAEVFIAEGDTVQEGDLLVRLEGTEQLQAAVAATEFELINAQYALDALHEDTDMIAAQSLQTAENAEDSLEDLFNRELQEALAQKAIADAQKMIDDSDRRLRNTQSTADQASIDAARAQVVLANDALEKARDDFEPYEDRPETNLTRANLQARLSAAQQVYDAAVRNLNALEGTGSEVDINVAQADTLTAQANLIEAVRDLDRVMEGPSEGDIAVLEAQIDSSYEDFEIYSQGPDPDDVALAEARVSLAEAQLSAAQAALDDLVLVAPFGGTIGDVNINASEWANPGQPIILLADLKNLQIETTDLSEIDVAQIEVGDPVIITFDAFSDFVLDGSVKSIAPKSAEGSGVNFTVFVEMAETPDALRWGMTAFVDIETGE